MVGVDTNVLVYAHLTGAPEHPVAVKVIEDLAGGNEPWAIAIPSLYEFVRVMTHPGAVQVPYSSRKILNALAVVCGLPNLVLLSHGPSHIEVASMLMARVEPIAGAAFDIQIAAILLESGVRKLFTRDRIFEQLGLEVMDPFDGLG